MRRILYFSGIIVIYCLVSGLYAQDFDFLIEVTDGTETDTLTIGVDPLGTENYDEGLDVLSPPPPPPGAFGTYLVWLAESYYTDIRDDDLTEKTFFVNYQPSTGGSIVLNWDSTGLGSLGSFTMQDRFGGTFFSLDMTTTNTLDISQQSSTIEDNLHIIVLPYDHVVQDSADIGSGDTPPQQIGSTSITVDFISGPGGRVYVEETNQMPINLSSGVISRTWDITSDMAIHTFQLDLRIDYSEADIAGLDENLLTIAYFDTIDSMWFELDSTMVFPDDNYVMAYELDHFTLFGVGESGTFNPLHSLANLRLFLDGPYSSGSMSTALRDNGYLPLAQPFNTAPWNYNGSELLADFPAGVVDWILVEIRWDTDASSVMERRAGFLMSNGDIVDLDGTSPLNFDGLEPGNYYVVLWHRNHVEVMTAVHHLMRQAPAQFDFTGSISRFYGSDAALLETGVYGPYGGDGNNDGFVNATDQISVWRPENGTDGYKTADFNLDGFINATDQVSVWRTNNGRGTKVP